MERAACRVVDANFNRAREAARVVEDFCRFALNSAPLSARAKELRHDLSAVMTKLDADRLITSRDTAGDVGVGTAVVSSQLSRDDLNDCFAAACRRLSEALRVLSETAQIEDRSVAEAFERLRYRGYSLERDVMLAARSAEKFGRVRLYVIITSCQVARVSLLVRTCAAAGADCIQLRVKGMEDDRLYALACEFVAICTEVGVLSVINDRVDVAVASGADGVHLGQSDLPIEQARRLQLTPLLIGRSTHTLEQLRQACADGPAYVSLGPVFATPTKPGASAVGLGYVRDGTAALAGTGVGHVAVGGITVQNVGDVLRAGARAVAVCSAVVEQADPAAACRALKEAVLAGVGGQ